MPKPKNPNIESLITEAQKKAAEKIFRDAVDEALRSRLRDLAVDLVHKWIKENSPRLSKVVNTKLTAEVEGILLQRAKKKLLNTHFSVFIDDEED